MQQKTLFARRPDAVMLAETPDGCYVFFREKIAETIVTDTDGNDVPAWEADEYTTFVRGNLALAEARVNAAPELWLGKAKAEAARKEAEAQAAEAEVTATDMLEILSDQEERLCMLEMLSGEV